MNQSGKNKSIIKQTFLRTSQSGKSNIEFNVATSQSGKLFLKWNNQAQPSWPGNCLSFYNLHLPKHLQKWSLIAIRHCCWHHWHGTQSYSPIDVMGSIVRGKGGEKKRVIMVADYVIHMFPNPTLSFATMTAKIVRRLLASLPHSHLVNVILPGHSPHLLSCPGEGNAVECLDKALLAVDCHHHCLAWQWGHLIKSTSPTLQE